LDSLEVSKTNHFPKLGCCVDDQGGNVRVFQGFLVLGLEVLPDGLGFLFAPDVKEVLGYGDVLSFELALCDYDRTSIEVEDANGFGGCATEVGLARLRFASDSNNDWNHD
jgi:hypothetical protein